MAGLITRLSLLAKNLTALKFGKVTKSGNAEPDIILKILKVGFSSSCVLTFVAKPRAGRQKTFNLKKTWLPNLGPHKS